MAREKIEVTVVRNDKEKSEMKAGLYVPIALPHYDVKRIVGAADVRLEDKEGVKAFLVGSQVSHEQLTVLCSDKATYEVTVLDGSTQR